MQYNLFERTLFDQEDSNIIKYKKVVNMEMCQRFQQKALQVNAKAHKINTDISGNWTHRRAEIANRQREKKDFYLKVKRILEKLSDLYKTGEIEHPDYQIVKNIKSASDIEHIFIRSFPPKPNPEFNNWYKEQYPKLKAKADQLGIDNQMKWEDTRRLLNDLSKIELHPIQQAQRQLEAMINELRPLKIPGFYPTPDDVTEFMYQIINPDPDSSILEPSAGIGSMINKIRKLGHRGDIHAIEIMIKLQNILTFQGIDLVGGDIFETEPVQQYDYIIMNAPFEKMQAIDHIVHVFNNFLKRTGELVALIPPTMITRGPNNKRNQFIDFAEENHVNIYPLGQKFTNAFKATGVNVACIHLKKIT